MSHLLQTVEDYIRYEIGSLHLMVIALRHENESLKATTGPALAPEPPRTLGNGHVVVGGKPAT
jgi:hypothetical protein